MDNSKGVPTHPWKALTALSFMEKMAVEDVFPAIYRSPPQPHYHKSGAVFGLPGTQHAGGRLVGAVLQHRTALHCTALHRTALL